MPIEKREVEVRTHTYTTPGMELHMETGKLAPHADGSVCLRIGDNSLLFTSVMGKVADPDKNFLPLMVDRRESFSAAGRIAGAPYRRREGRPSTNATLYARMTDRAMRPLFPKGMINEVILSVTPLSLDQTRDMGVVSIIGASVATMLAGIPFSGPVGAARIARIDGKLVPYPTKDQLENADMNLLVAGPKGVINMIECDAKEVPEEVVKKACELGQELIDAACDMQEEFVAQHTVHEQSISYNKPSPALLEYIENMLTDDWKEKLFDSEEAFGDVMRAFEQEALGVCAQQHPNNPEYTPVKIKLAVFAVIKKAIRNKTMNSDQRLDGRAMNQIRPLYCEVDTVPRVHGSGLFRRGGTQVLSTVTLGSPGDYLLHDNMEQDYEKQYYFHHYNFPPFSTNDARGTRGTNRRELGHGALAEKALEYMIPDREKFPYAIRVVSECLGSGGSTSMGSVCGSTLSLMAAGVPITAPVSGIAMGLMTEQDDQGNITAHKVLTDLKGTEDFVGDMDFKVAGTAKGITAIQLDTKIAGLTPEIVQETIDRAETGRKDILQFMLQTIETPREELSPYAPKIEVITIDPDKIKEVIGKGGETIDEIIEKAGGVKIDFEDDGTCFITDTDAAKIQKAIELIKDIAEDLPLHTELEGKISRVEKYGVFVSLPRKRSGLCHIKSLKVPSHTDISRRFSVGDPIKVRITEIDKQGRYNLERVV